MRGVLAAAAAGAAVIACCAALPVTLAALGGVTLVAVLGSLGVAFVAAALLVALSVRRRRASCATSLPGDQAIAAPPQIKVPHEGFNR